MNQINTKLPVVIYTESTPNPATLKFVTNKGLLPHKHIEIEKDKCDSEAPFALDLFKIDGVSHIFISQNFVTVTKMEDEQWISIIPHVKSIIKEYMDNDLPLFTEHFIFPAEKATNEISDQDSDVNIRIKTALDKYVKPAVENDGGAITFVSFEEGILTLALEGSCNGCPSSTVTLKNGIENLMQKMIPEVKEVVALS